MPVLGCRSKKTLIKNTGTGTGTNLKEKQLK